MLTRLTLLFALSLPSFGFAAQTKEEACALQGEMVGAIQQARLDRMAKDAVVPTLMQANPQWPASVETAMPGLVNWVYDQRRRDLKKVQLGPTVQTQCLENWEQIKALSQTVTN